MHTYLIGYQEKGITDVLHRVIKAHSKKEAEYLLKLRQDPDNKHELSVKDVHLLDKSLSEPFTTRHTDATSSFALHNHAYQRYQLINRHPGKGGII